MLLNGLINSAPAGAKNGACFQSGSALNKKRLKAQPEKYEALKESIRLIENIVDRKQPSMSESEGSLRVIGDFSCAFDSKKREKSGTRSRLFEENRNAEEIQECVSI